MRHSPLRAIDAALSALKVKDLHRLVTATGLVQTGTKTELLERLKPYIPATTTAAAAGGDCEGTREEKAEYANEIATKWKKKNKKNKQAAAAGK